MKLQAVAAVAALGVALTGCASIMTGTTQTVSVTTIPVSGAECTVKNGFGQWNVTTPGQVVINKSMRHALVTCDKPGYQRSYAWLLSQRQPWIWANAAVPLEIGNIVDWSDGAGGKYPEAISVPLKPIVSADTSPPSAQPSKQPAVGADALPAPGQPVNQAAVRTEAASPGTQTPTQPGVGAAVAPAPVQSQKQAAAGSEIAPSSNSSKPAS
jgi:hypothetical protein